MKKRPKWFQQTSFNQPNTSDTSYCVFKNLYPSSSEDTTTEEISTQNITTNNKPSSNEMTKDDFLIEIHQFKQQKLYEEALSCIQLLFEKNIVDSDIILLLEIQLLLVHGKKEETLTTLNHLLSNKITLKNEKDYQLLDMIIEKLKKIFKADKLMRRCPNLNTYQKQRRQSLKTQKQKNPVTHDLTVHQSTVINSAKGVIMPDTNTNINPALQNTINQIWDMQIANKENISTILATPCEQVSQCIMSQVLSYKKKIWLFNYLADIFRTHNNLQSAIFLLRQALLLDDENDFILKNLGYLLCQNGEYPNALVVLKDIKHKDFAVLDLIAKCQDLKN